MAFSPHTHTIKTDPFGDLPTSSSSRTQTTAGDAGGGVVWTPNGPMLKLENAVVETVVTHTTRTTTSFAPIPLPRIPLPESIPRPSHLSPLTYPLSNEPSPEDLRVFGINLGGRNVIVRDDMSMAPQEEEPTSNTSGPGWTRALPGDPEYRDNTTSINLAEALLRSKGKDVRKRPHDLSGSQISNAPTPPITADVTPLRPRRSPPRKKIRGLGLEDVTLAQEHNAPLSPLPSPEPETMPLLTPSQSTSSLSQLQSSANNGLELAALFSLPSIVSHYELLPDKLQQQVLMHLLRRSRMPTIQRTCAFAARALKRDFVTELPHEISILVLRHLDRPALAMAARVSKSWHRMIETERVVWLQRLVDDDLFYGHGAEKDDESLVTNRMDALEWMASKRRTKSYTAVDKSEISFQIPMIRPVPLKHVYRRRWESRRNWLETRSEHMSFPGHGTQVVTSLQFDSDKVVTGSDDNTISVYSLATGQIRRRFDGHEGGVWALEYSGDILVTGSTDRTVRVWDLEALTETHVFHGHTSTVRCLKIIEPVLDEATGEYYPPYPMFVTGSRDSTLRVWKLPKKGEKMEPEFDEEGEEVLLEPNENPWHIRALRGHSGAVRAVAAHGRVCISGSYDKELRVWDVLTGQCKHILRGHEQKVYSVAYDHHRKQCTSGSMDHTVKVWNVTTGQCLHTLTGHSSLIGLLGLSPNHIVSAAADASLRVWDANTHKLKHELVSHGGAISCFQHDENKVVSGSDGALKLWDLRTGQYVRDLVVGITSIWQVAFKDNLLVSVANRSGTAVFDVFDFGSTAHISGVDDDRLDKLRRPPWEKPSPSDARESRSYQIDEDDYSGGVQMSGSRSKASRRSSRIASKVVSGSFPSDPTVSRGSRSKSDRRATAHLAIEYSPSPAGPSGLGSSSRQMASSSSARRQRVSESFAPIFDQDPDDMMDEIKMEEGEDESADEAEEYVEA